jgi:hypothetical protein
MCLAYFEMEEGYAKTLDYINDVFTGIFLLELVVKQLGLGVKQYFADKWFEPVHAIAWTLH